MLEQILNLDRSFFIAINNGMANPVLDWLCPYLRKQETWYFFYPVLLYFLYKKTGPKSLWFLLSIALMIFCSDQFSANLVKNTFQRVRPCSAPDLQGITRHLIESCRGYSFISAHACNHFAIAVFFAKVLQVSKWNWFLLLFWASSIAFSQVYVGVHYPLDVIVGACCGILFGIAFSRYTLKYTLK
jgi:membrane-associated phospholipid phosphatase